ncbi:hypothetical protein HMI55_004425 [Coelomomyces lativittatus]|nr:hypothetical protein HMI56_004021 [Coelomomyces lativittatus]KAJ1514723.1 hypothetical protein HMI55_004425 [Coelomomyces lativittatus]
MSLNKLIQSTVQAVSEVTHALSSSNSNKNYCIVTGHIVNACRQDRHEPDLALNLEICDLINQKGRTVYVFVGVVCLF